jgi:hypothetical protein
MLDPVAKELGGFALSGDVSDEPDISLKAMCVGHERALFQCTMHICQANWLKEVRFRAGITGIEVNMENSIYREEHQIFRDSFRKFVAKEITPFVPQWEEARAVPREIWLKMGEQGFLCPWLPEIYGGLGLGFEYSVIINEELTRGDGFGVGVPLHQSP